MSGEVEQVPDGDTSTIEIYEDAHPARYRVGNHQPQNIYDGDTYIGVMFSARDAARVVDALNRAERE